jgi:hypothetical protein
MNPLHTLILKRRHTVFVTQPQAADADSPSAVESLELALIELGFLLSRELRDALCALPAQQLAATGRWLKETLELELGGGRPHVPLFRGFPATVPPDTWQIYVRRVLTWLFQSPEQPCLMCGRVGTVSALDPCGHLVCHACWDGSDYSACPLCHRRISLADPFLRPSQAISGDQTAHLPMPTARLKLLHLGHDPEAVAGEWFRRLLSRQSPLSPNDRADLLGLIEVVGSKVVTWVPEQIPVRETVGWLFGSLLRLKFAPDLVLSAAAPHLRNATDVLRVIWVWSGGAADLVSPPERLRSMPRALRKGFLAALEKLDLAPLCEDLRRHREAWKRAGESLHPFEFAARFPKAAAAFAVLRKTRAAQGKLNRALQTSALAPGADQHFDLGGGELRFTSWAGKLEQALRDKNLDAALRLLGRRPGNFFRRLDHLLRLAADGHPHSAEQVLRAVEATAGKVSPAVLLSVLGQLRKRGQPLGKRVFFPRGDVLRAFSTWDTRPPLPERSIAPVVTTIEKELLRRAAARANFTEAVVDTRLRMLAAPFNERSTSKSLISVPRGSLLPVPEGESLRLFLHWMQPETQRVDLDLSVSLYDGNWRFKGPCDFTNLVFGDRAAVHSGDLTSAPAPLGASEFVDLDVPKLLSAGVRFLVFVVFSYNGVPFEELPDAFAGFMLRSSAEGKTFDAKAVAQRYDLQGKSVVSVPMIVDLAERRMRWVDVHAASRGHFHQVGGYNVALAHLGLDLTAYFDAGTRLTLWEVSCLHAAARAQTVFVRDDAGRVTVFQRRPAEDAHEFFTRLTNLNETDGHEAEPPAAQGPRFVSVWRDDLPIPDQSAVYTLYGERLSPERVRRLSASDLLAELAG